MTTSDCPLPTEPNTVNVCVQRQSSNWQVIVNPENLPVQGQYVVITFKMLTEGATFTDSGAVTMIGSTTQFPLAAWTESAGRTVKLFDFNSDTKDYQYNLSVNPPGDNSGMRLAITVDPGIQNGR